MRASLVLALLWILLQASAGRVGACTVFALLDRDTVVVGKNLDWEVEDGALLINPRGVGKESLDGRLRWVSHFGSVTFNQLGREFPLGGMNEAGLVVEEASYWSSRYPETGDRPTINEFQWIQYQLDRYATVAEVVAGLDELAVKPVIGGLHYFVADVTGAVAIVEFLDGEAIVHHATIPVLTNNTYANSLRYLERHVGFGGTRQVGPGPESPERFVRVAGALRDAATTPPAANRILDDVAQSDTVWRVVYDPSTLTVHWRTASVPVERWLQVDAGDFATGTRGRGLLLSAIGEADAREDLLDWDGPRQSRLAASVFGQLELETITVEDLAAGRFAAPVPAATVTFLANAGVQVELAGSTILVDALFDLNFSAGAPPSRYSHLDREDLDRLERGEAPFRCADFVLVTHGHDDHATRVSVLRQLQNCPEAGLFLPQGSWGDGGAPWPPGRAHPVDVPRGSARLVEDGEVRIEALAYRHGSRTGNEPAHVGWLIAGGGLRILHVGDATPMPDNLHDFGGVLAEPVDLALVPHWFVTHEGGRTWLMDELQPRRIAVVHVVEKDPRVMEDLAKVKARHPELVVLSRPFEQIELRPAREP